MDNLDLTSINNSSHTITEMTKSGSTDSGTFTYSRLIENTALTNIILRLDGANRITSVSKYANYYTFILIMEKDINSSGRLFNHSSANQLFGFWGNQVGSIWLNANVKLNHKDNESKQKFMVLRNNNGTKDAWLNGAQYVIIGDNR